MINELRDLALENMIFGLREKPEDFNEVALSVFDFQYNNTPVYRQFCDLIGVKHPQSFQEIPFLPIAFFKNKTVLNQDYKEIDCRVFKSSGTTGQTRSSHFVPFDDLYERSFLTHFIDVFGPIEDLVIFALLPNYHQQGYSSLVYMVSKLIEKTNNPLSGFYLNEIEKLTQEILNLKKSSKKRVVLFGVTYALLDLAEKGFDFNHVTVIETGGMKGRRKEMLKSTLHDNLKSGLNLNSVQSEYGMTELMSQAYLLEGLNFYCAPWMKVMIRDINDPFCYLHDGKTGGINVIDLANLYSCSFISTQDLGVSNDGRFEVMGRFDNSDIRGCNLLVS